MRLGLCFPESFPEPWFEASPHGRFLRAPAGQLGFPGTQAPSAHAPLSRASRRQQSGWAKSVGLQLLVNL